MLLGYRGLCLLLLWAHHAHSEFYSSVQEMSKLVKHEDFFLRNMDRLVEESEKKLDFLREKLLELEQARDEAVEEGPEYLESPVNRFLLTKRLTVDWERIQNMMAHDVGEKFLQKIIKKWEKLALPDVKELEGAIEGFLRIQTIYRLRTRDMARGVLRGVSYGTELEARHCFDIGRFALQQPGQLKLGLSWLEEALRRHRPTNETAGAERLQAPLTRATILEAVADAKARLGDRRGARAAYEELLAQRPDDAGLRKAYDEVREADSNDDVVIDYSEELDPVPERLLEQDEFQLFRYTCNGHIRPSAAEERELRCGYLTETHPFLLLAPIKVEELHHDPLLVLYHDVVYDGEIATMRRLVENRIQRATVVGLNGSLVSSSRTSQFVFLPQTAHEVLRRIDERVQDMTNLNMRYAEDHQFANYGIGGHYVQHFDWFDLSVFGSQVSRLEMGNRLATVLFYLSDVEQGGGTAFPYLKRLLLPQKGAAAFWYNLHASGQGDVRSKHGACPIIVGSKWVQNRWIREYFQDDRRPCELYNDAL